MLVRLMWFLAGICCVAAHAQYNAPRTSDGKPNLNGIWQALNTANFDIQAHTAEAAHIVAEGARGAVPAGTGIVEGNELPYLPAALAQKRANQEKRGWGIRPGTGRTTRWWWT